jgi:hypothetical protein
MKKLSPSRENALPDGVNGGAIAGAAFPLILAFSPGEKERPPAAFIKSESFQAISRRLFASMLGAIPPLPRGEGERAGFSLMLNNRLKLSRFALSAFVFLVAVTGVMAQQLPLGHATDFTSSTYYEPPHETQLKMKLSGAEASPLPGGLLDVKRLRIETFGLDGKPESVVSAPQCIYAPLDGAANSSGKLEMQTSDGKLRVEGEGFLWRQTNSLLTISNHVHTVIDLPTLKPPA